MLFSSVIIALGSAPNGLPGQEKAIVFPLLPPSASLSSAGS